MILSIPFNNISGGKGGSGNYSRNFNNELKNKISRFKLTILALKDYQNDPNFYINNIRYLFSDTGIEFLNDDSEYQYVYDIMRVYMYLVSYLNELSNIKHIHGKTLVLTEGTIDMRYTIVDDFVDYFIRRFEITKPLIESFKYIISDSTPDSTSNDMIISRVKAYIKDNNIELSLPQPPSKDIILKLLQDCNIIAHVVKYTNKKALVNAVSDNLDEYIKVLDCLTDYLLKLEKYYLYMTRAVYKLDLDVESQKKN